MALDKYANEYPDDYNIGESLEYLEFCIGLILPSCQRSGMSNQPSIENYSIFLLFSSLDSSIA